MALAINFSIKPLKAPIMKNLEALRSELWDKAEERAARITHLKTEVLIKKVTVFTLLLLYVTAALLCFLFKIDHLIFLYCLIGVSTPGILILFYILFRQSKTSEKLISEQFEKIVDEKIKDIESKKEVDTYLSLLKEIKLQNT